MEKFLNNDTSDLDLPGLIWDRVAAERYLSTLTLDLSRLYYDLDREGLLHDEEG